MKKKLICCFFFLFLIESLFATVIEKNKIQELSWTLTSKVFKGKLESSLSLKIKSQCNISCNNNCYEITVKKGTKIEFTEIAEIKIDKFWNLYTYFLLGNKRLQESTEYTINENIINKIGAIHIAL